MRSVFFRPSGALPGLLPALLGTAFTFLMTAAGAALVFFFRRAVGERPQRVCMGFAGGVMAAASVFSLLVPAAEQAAQRGGCAWLVVTLGFLLGAGLLMLPDAAMLRARIRADSAREEARRRALLFTAITLHNVPEGMAVGLAFALAAREGGSAMAAAAALALGIGIQNFPEGAAISLPMRQSGMSRKRSFLLGVLSGAVEPVFGVLVVLVAAAAQAVMPLLMAFAAGAMMLVVFEEMIPEAAGGRAGVTAAVLGYALMMALDVALG
ncbi:MAG: ZIP family metal transporter [Clostridiales bacterium]|nr:ZIP family metal transporter [Clostridiales bacterium]MDY5349953.1 ZIP family metal transporter [Candidatus Ventricola sp.]MDY5513261.1 ZIP family metal transporter [Candidatus Ventricola sp.]